MPLSSEERFKAIIDALSETEGSLAHGETIYRELKLSVKRMRRALLIAIGGILLDLVLTGIIVAGLVSQNHLSQRINTNADTLHQVECSTNSLFISVDTPANYAAAPDKAQYTAQFHVIYQQRIQLGCQPTISEPMNRG